MHNIEKSGFRKGEYVGYAHGVWSIRKSNSSFGNWVANKKDDQRAPTLYGFTLKELSRKLSEYESKPHTNPARKSRHKGRRVVKRKLTSYRHRNVKKVHTAIRKTKRVKKRAKRNPKSTGHFVYVEYNNKKYWLTDLSRLDTDKSKAKRFPDLISAKIAARGIGPRVSDKVEGIWVT